ncbi:hypothetical protein OIE66_25730 [Nonomuraea sp. NBC_01738]|uniref:hypothetical protein n=1 Tax=Nonomuraea sp. NBC_01738 TaxID=2976003 RepID=UPI002E1293E8|nr:hypothetical protein OIE66_25730 [Nonomuraea sp. NBC_01738]
MRRITALALLIPLVAACQNAPAPVKTRAAPPTVTKTAAKYSTGGDTDDDPCTRVVSAIGYAGLMLGPEGRENSQKFENALLGRLAELRGITQEFGSRLPEGLRADAQEVEETTHGLARADVPHARQVKLLKQYRSAADRIVAGCT